MNTFANKLDALSDNFQSELDKLHKAIRDEIEEYVKEELENKGIPKNSELQIRIEYYHNDILIYVLDLVNTIYIWDNPVFSQLAYEIDTVSHDIKQVFEIPHTFTYWKHKMKSIFTLVLFATIIFTACYFALLPFIAMIKIVLM